MNTLSPCDWESFFVDCLSCFPFLYHYLLSGTGRYHRSAVELRLGHRHLGGSHLHGPQELRDED